MARIVRTDDTVSAVDLLAVELKVLVRLCLIVLAEAIDGLPGLLTICKRQLIGSNSHYRSILLVKHLKLSVLY